jgi:NAD(P)-dependent dehydrogenase (short-subunit alcohol dehydrogenase family)
MGRATALTFAREGASVVGCDVAVEPAEATVEMAREAGGEMVSLQPCRLSDPADCAKLVELRKSHDSRFNTGTGVMIGAGALATATVIYAVWALGSGGSDEKPPPSTTPVSLVPSFGPAGGGLSLQGAF